MPQTYITAAEAAPRARVSVWHIQALCREGKLKAYKPGGQWLIAEEDLDAYILSGANEAAAS